jgi:myo-inositol-1(or 4)-monophosphatase
MKSLEEYLEIAQKITDLAGDFALENFGPFKQTFHKSGLEYGIEEDKQTNLLYEDFLKTHTPEVALYTEEGEKTLDNELVWTVDPIDGTSNYGVGNAYFNTQISLLKNHLPVIGII